MRSEDEIVKEACKLERGRRRRIAEKILETVAKEERAERAVKPGKSARAPYARSLALAGSGHSDRTDVSRDKHGHLAEIYAGKPERR